MKEKIFKKGITRRLLSVVLTLAMVLSLLSLNATLVYAAEPVLGEKIESSAKEVSGTDFKVESTKYENYGSYGEWVIGGANNATITVSRTADNTTKNIGKLVFGYADVSHEDPSGSYWINTDYFTGCEGARVEYDGEDKLTIFDLNTSSITIGFSDTNAALLPDYVEIYYVDAPAIEISNVEVDFSQIPIAVGTTKAQMDAASITIKVDDVDMTDAFDITEKSLFNTIGDTKTIIESNYFLNYSYVIIFEPKAGYSFASDFNEDNISITTPTASNIDGTNKSYISGDNSIRASFHFDTRPTQIKATSVSEYWLDWMTPDEMANITFTTNDSDHPTVCIDTQGGYTNWGDIVGGCCDASGNLNTEYLSGPCNFRVRFGEKYYGEDYTDWMNVTSAKITLFGEGYSSKLLSLEMNFSDGDKSYLLKYDAHKITYYEPKEQGSSEWKVMTEDLVTPTENSSKTNSLPNYAPSGKEFTGWTTTKNGTSGYSFGSPLTENIELYPMWGDHVHDWEYTADDSTLTATCTKNSAHTATLTISASSANYSGNPVYKDDLFGDMDFDTFKDATKLSLSTDDIEIYAADDTSKSTPLNKINAAGSYVATLTVGEQTATLDFTVAVARCNICVTCGHGMAHHSNGTNGCFHCQTEGACVGVDKLGDQCVLDYDHQDAHSLGSHAWEYTVEDNVLSAKCKGASNGCTFATCGHDTDETAVSLTLAASDKDYSGSAVTANYGEGEAKAWKDVTGNDAPVIAYQQKIKDEWTDLAEGTEPTAVGEYRAVAEIIVEETAYTAYKEFSINSLTIEKVEFTTPEVDVTKDVPQKLAGIPEEAKYTGEISWAPADSKYKYDTAYTATVTLTAAEGYEFDEEVLIPTGWEKDEESTATELILTKTYDKTPKAKVTSVTEPKVETQLKDYTTKEAQLEELNKVNEVAVEVEDESKTSMQIEWALKKGTTYTNASEGVNTFVWTIKDTEYADYDIAEGVDITGEVEITNPKCEVEKVDGLAATCTEDGWKDYYECTVDDCERLYEDEKLTTEITNLDAWKISKAGKLKALGHIGGQATCMAKAVCTRCEKEYGEIKEHVYEATFTVDKKATCTEAGSKSKHCATEGCKERARVTEIPALGHTGGKATCQAKAVCSRCKEPYGELGKHDFAADSKTCRTKGCTEANPNYVVAPTTPKVSVSYQTHIQTYGDSQGFKKDGEMAGTAGEAKRLESLKVKVSGNANLGIAYTTHVQTYGWLPWSHNGEVSGTSGEAKRMEALKIQLKGADASKYDVYYRVHAQTYGWLAWAKNGEAAGTAGLAKRLEGIQIVVVEKGKTFNQNMGNIKSNNAKAFIKGTSATTDPVKYDEPTPNVMYKTHVQTFGWQNWKTNGAMSGTSGLAKRLEGINIKLTNAPYAGGIQYKTHVQTFGWEKSWRADGAMSGTSGLAKRLEGIRIELTGEMAKHYDVYYRVHAQSFGWLGWAKNGESAGTEGLAKRLEGIQIVLVKKGDKAPAANYGGITSKTAKPFIKK